MAIKKPLVVKNGQIQELPAGDTLSATVNVAEGFTFANRDDALLSPGAPVRFVTDGGGGVNLASAASATLAKVLGLVGASGIALNATGTVQRSGTLTLLTSEWNTVISDANPNGLSAGATYFLSETEGKITSAPPTGAGKVVVPIGLATSSTAMLIDTYQVRVLLS